MHSEYNHFQTAENISHLLPLPMDSYTTFLFSAIFLLTKHSYPYYKDDGIPSSSNRYFDALKTVDLTLKGLFEILDKTNHLHDTIIIGSGDHGGE